MRTKADLLETKSHPKDEAWLPVRSIIQISAVEASYIQDLGDLQHPVSAPNGFTAGMYAADLLQAGTWQP